MNDEFNLAAATKVLTYPITIASILHNFHLTIGTKGPFDIRRGQVFGGIEIHIVSTTTWKIIN